MSEIKDRLTKFLEYKGYGQLKFENTAGLGRGWFQLSWLQPMVREYGVNARWLLTGFGKMFDED